MPNSLKLPFGRTPKAVSINRGSYAMEMADGENAEITMYGEIMESRPTDWETGKPVEGNYIIQSEFLEDLKSLSSAKSLTIRMNSLGGDAGVSMLIHNRLREMAAQGTALTCIVDGVAMSGGSLIMCACDNVEVNPSSIIMIHKCWSFLFGGYNADELKEMAARNEAWDKAQVSIYKRKCSLSDVTISNMMAKTTYMTGTEAVEKGFADKLLSDAEPLNIAASADGRSLFVRGKQFRLIPGMFAPDSIPTVTPEAAASGASNKNYLGQTGEQNGGKTMANSLEELRVENPALAEALMAETRVAVSTTPGGTAPVPAPAVTPAPAPQAGADVVSAAVQAEQKRIQEIDELSALYDAETVNAAKYGENACTAQEMAYRAAQKAAKKGKKFLDDLDDDAKTSGAQGVQAAGDPGAPPPEEAMTPNQRMDAARAKVKTLFQKEEK